MIEDLFKDPKKCNETEPWSPEGRRDSERLNGLKGTLENNDISILSRVLFTVLQGSYKYKNQPTYLVRMFFSHCTEDDSPHGPH